MSYKLQHVFQYQIKPGRAADCHQFIIDFIAERNPLYKELFFLEDEEQRTEQRLTQLENLHMQESTEYGDALNYLDEIESRYAATLKKHRYEGNLFVRYMVDVNESALTLEHLDITQIEFVENALRAAGLLYDGRKKIK